MHVTCCVWKSWGFGGGNAINLSIDKDGKHTKFRSRGKGFKVPGACRSYHPPPFKQRSVVYLPRSIDDGGASFGSLLLVYKEPDVSRKNWLSFLAACLPNVCHGPFIKHETPEYNPPGSRVLHYLPWWAKVVSNHRPPACKATCSTPDVLSSWQARDVAHTRHLSRRRSEGLAACRKALRS